MEVSQEVGERNLVSICVFLLLLAPCAARTITVDDDGPADFNNIQAAIDDANDGDTVIVKDGVYKGVGNRDIDFKNKAITVRSTDPNDPNVVAATIIDCDSNTGDRHSGFVFVSGEDTNSVLAGLTITDGSITGRGGAISCVGSSPTITNCTLTGNRASLGGAISCEDGDPVIKNCIITRNQAGEGGAILCRDGSPVIKNCIITRNQAGEGGAIGCERAYPVIINCIISYNDSFYRGGGIYRSYEPGMPTGTLNIRDSTFIGNWAFRDGGAIDGRWCLVEITNCTFMWNIAGDDGGAAARCYGMFADCVFIGNSGAGEGGAMYDCAATITNCLFSCNSAGVDGGAIYYCMDVQNCTFSANSADGRGGGIYNLAPGLNVTNCTLWGNTDSRGTGKTAQIAGALPSVTFSCIQDDDPNDANIPFGGAANNNIDDNPIFVRDPNDGGDGWGDDPATPDVNEGANDDFGDLHLRSGSPCINAGHPYMWFEPNSVDMDGEPRVMGYVVDMGADEFFMPMVVVAKPAGGEVWASGSIHEIAWATDLYYGTVDILFSEDGGSGWQTIGSSTADTGSYVWELPGEVDSNQCVISVVPSVPDPNVVIIDSGLFTIQRYPSRPPAPPGQMRKWDNFRRTGLSDTFGPEIGCVKWQFETEGPVSASVSMGPNSTVYVPCEDGNLYKLDANGTLLWSYDTNSPIISSPAVGYYGMIYVGGENGKLYAIDGKGKLRWTHTADGFVYSSAAVSAEGNVYVCSEDGKLYALGPDGSELWTFEIAGPGAVGSPIFASPSIGPDGTVYIAGLRDPNLYALDPNDGSVKWACNFESAGRAFASPVVAADGTIYQTLLFDPNLYAVEPNTGSILWSLKLADVPIGDVDGWSEPATGPDGTIYVSSSDPYLRAVEPNGSIKWVTQLGMADGFTLTVGSDGFVYAAGNDGYLSVVDTNGQERARFQSDGWLTRPVITADNTMIVSDVNNRIWAIGGEGCEDEVLSLHRPEDVDGSRAINFTDFALFAIDWLGCNDPLAPCSAAYWDETYFTGDIDRNLYVDFADLKALADRWLSEY